MRFFHISALVRCRRNKVETLKGEDGQWEDDMEKLKNMVVKFYSDLFTIDPLSGGVHQRPWTRRS